ncbi:Uncharacterised protein [uncultured archaeon]|nr:Uncharacterised protein [uncultured archaeon]
MGYGLDKVSGCTQSSATCAISSSVSSSDIPYRVSVQVTDSASSTSDVAVTNITVYPALSAAVSPIVRAAVDLGQTLQVSSSGAGGSGAYAYVWSSSPESVCPGFVSQAAPSFAFTPSASTAGCAFAVAVEDTATSDVVSVRTPDIVVNAQLSAIAAPKTSGNASIIQGQKATILGMMPNGGTPPYSYGWLVSYNGSSFAAVNATFCSPFNETASSYDSVACIFQTTNSTPPGDYAYELRVVDSATSPFFANSSGAAHVKVAARPKPDLLAESLPIAVPIACAAAVLLGTCLIYLQMMKRRDWKEGRRAY